MTWGFFKAREVAYPRLDPLFQIVRNPTHSDTFFSMKTSFGWLFTILLLPMAIAVIVSLTGIVKAPEFREAVLNQRERQGSNQSQATRLQSVGEPESSSDGTSLLVEIRDSLSRIESILEETRNP